MCWRSLQSKVLSRQVRGPKLWNFFWQMAADCCSVQGIVIRCLCKFWHTDQRLAACPAFPSFGRKGCSASKLLAICETAVAGSLLLCFQIFYWAGQLGCFASQAWPFDRSLPIAFACCTAVILPPSLELLFHNKASTAVLANLLQPLWALSVLTVAYTIAHRAFLSVFGRTACKIAWLRYTECSAEAPDRLLTKAVCCHSPHQQP